MSAPGPIALVGSGEYLPQMEDVDRELLSHVGGDAARVVVLPTASGLEQLASPRRWADMGVRHFTGLGAQVDVVNILGREDAFKPQWLPLLERADLIYFSGGSPRHVVDTMAGSPAWDVIRARHAAGAVLAGCSAGAMAFGRVTLQPRVLWGSNATPPRSEIWYPALGLLAGIVALPHFDRWVGRMGEATLRQLAASLPKDVALIGVDEDTALVSFDGYATWRVMGRRSVSVIDARRGQVRHAAGASLELNGSVAPL
jgi:cyanophycinase